MARSRRDDWDDDPDNVGRRRRPKPAGHADAVGVAGLMCGILASLCLLLGAVTCGLTFFAVAPVAAVGTGCSAYGRGAMRVVGLALNILMLIPGLLLLGFMVFGIGKDWIVPLAQRG